MFAQSHASHSTNRPLVHGEVMTFTPVYSAGRHNAVRAYLFRSRANRETWAVTLENYGTNLPSGPDAWDFEREFALGVREPMPVNANPEPVLRGLKARGFFVGRTRSNPLGTSQ